MKSFFIFLLMMIKIYFPDSDGGTTENKTSIAGRYQVVETSLPDTWNKRVFVLSKDNLIGDGRQYILTGFTNNGVSVKGLLSYPEIQFQRQSVTVIPEGGDGKKQWTIDMDAQGTFDKNMLELNYRIFENNAIIVGKIKAEKISE